MSPDFNKKIKDILTWGIQEDVFPGCALLVAHQGKIVFQEGVGLLSKLPGAGPVQDQTIFDLASLTKPLATTLALMKLVDQGKLDLDQPLAGLLNQDIPPDKTAITTRLLLCHSAGLMDYQTFYLDLEKAEPAQRKVMLRKKILKASLVYPPGQGVTYSDLGFMLLEWIIEQKAGIPLARLMEKYFWGPLALQRTFLNDYSVSPRFSQDQFAATEDCPWRHRTLQGETHDENAHALGGYSGHAGLFGTAQEEYRLVDLLREHYQGLRHDYFKPETVRLFFTRQHMVPESTWALGWDTPSPKNSSAGRYFSKNSVGHLGFTGTSVWMDLDQDVIAILLTNRVHPTRKNDKIRAFRPKIHDAVMEALGLLKECIS